MVILTILILPIQEHDISFHLFVSSPVSFISILKFSKYRSFASFFKKINLFIYLFLSALGLRCCAHTFSTCGEWGLLFIAVRGLLIVVASLVLEHGL